VPPTKGEFELEMNRLESEIKRLEAEYNMFFTHRAPKPPLETRKRVDALVKKHDRSYIQNTADRFRFLTIQTRYAKLNELWERQLNNHDYGKPKRFASGAPMPDQAAAAKAAKAAEKPPDKAADKTADKAARADKPVEPPAAGERLVHVAKVRDPAAEPDRVKELYEQLAEARKQTGEAPVAFDRVAALVKAQVDKFKADGTEVSFRVAMKDGKVSLTVKPVKDGE
jgi:hypothetical protein